jgi:DNA-binding cell septation regulator SpoVG
MTITVTDVRFTSASQVDRAHGLLGFITFTLNDALIIDGVGLRRTLLGSLTLSFPTRKDANGKLHAIARPTDDAVRCEMTRQVLEALGVLATADVERRRQAEVSP